MKRSAFMDENMVVEKVSLCGQSTIELGLSGM